MIDFNVNSIGENSSIAYILQVELNYPDDLHELHNDYPLAPENLEISQNMVRNYCNNIANEYGIKIGGVNKLVLNLGNKSMSFTTEIIFIRNHYYCIY